MLTCGRGCRKMWRMRAMTVGSSMMLLLADLCDTISPPRTGSNGKVLA